MKLIRIVLPMMLALFLILVQTGCQPNKAGQADALILTDARGSEVALTVNPGRVIAIDPSMCDILYAIGAQDSLVAVGSYCEYPPEVAQKPKVGAYSDLNVEELIALTPDLILFGTMSTEEAKIEALKSAGIEIAVLRADTIADAYKNIADMGALMGRKEQAAKVAEEMKSALDNYASLGAAQDPKKKVFIEISPLMSGLYTCGSGTFQDELIMLIGAENIFAAEERWAAVSEEQVISLNPDVIISTSQYDGYDPVSEICARSGWEGVTAVKNGDVYFLDSSIVSLACPRLAIGAEQLYEVVYGE